MLRLGDGIAGGAGGLEADVAGWQEPGKGREGVGWTGSQVACSAGPGFGAQRGGGSPAGLTHALK